MTVPSSLSVLPSRSTCLGVGGDHLAGDLADDLQDAAVVVHGVGRVDAAVVVRAVAAGEAVLLERPFRQVDVVEENWMSSLSRKKFATAISGGCRYLPVRLSPTPFP